MQVPALWQNYAQYRQSQTHVGTVLREYFYWHGTKTTHPKVIYEGVGFDKAKAHVGILSYIY